MIQKTNSLALLPNSVFVKTLNQCTACTKRRCPISFYVIQKWSEEKLIDKLLKHKHNLIC